MARHTHTEGESNDWILWLVGIAAAWYLYSSGTLSNIFSGLTLPSLTTTSTVPVTNSQGKVPTAATPGSTQVEPTAVYVNDVNVSSEDQYSL